MQKETRYEHILNGLKTSDRIDLETVAKDLNVSEDTIRRDIDLLNKRGLLVKVRGGAISPSKNPLAFHDRETVFTEGKDVIALKTIPLLDSSRTIFMDGGTTMLSIASRLPVDAAFRVITNNMALVPVLSTFPNIEIVVLGGTYNRITQTNTGLQTCLEAQRFHADLFLMGVCAIDVNAGVTAAVSDDGEIKKIFMQSSAQTIALSNYEKLGSRDFFKVCGLESIDTLVTDIPSDDKRLDVFRELDLRIV